MWIDCSLAPRTLLTTAELDQYDKIMEKPNFLIIPNHIPEKMFWDG